MDGNQIEELHHTRGIDALVAAKAGRDRMLRVPQINQSNRKLRLSQFLISKFVESCMRCIIDELYQRALASRSNLPKRTSLLTIGQHRPSDKRNQRERKSILHFCPHFAGKE